MRVLVLGSGGVGTAVARTAAKRNLFGTRFSSCSSVTARTGTARSAPRRPPDGRAVRSLGTRGGQGNLGLMHAIESSVPRHQGRAPGHQDQRA